MYVIIKRKKTIGQKAMYYVKTVSKEFGKTKQGEKVIAYEMQNSNGMSVRILNFGGIIQSLQVPDRNGNPIDVVLGYDNIESYENGTNFYGAIIGRYANRIKDAHFILEGKEYQLEKNCEQHLHHLHGIYKERIFNVIVDNDTLILNYFSPDKEEGYPGNLNVEVRYTLCEDNTLQITYKATTDATTIVNLTNHSYFNLNGQDGSTILDHRVLLNCSHFTEYSDTFAQTGKIIPVDNTPLDFRTEHVIGERIEDDYRQLRICNGYDHNMVLIGELGELKLIGIVHSDKTGICLEAYTTEPAVQFYTGNFMSYNQIPHGKNNIQYPKNGGFCLEAQHYPDSINHPNFPNTILRPGEIYTQKTLYRFK